MSDYASFKVPELKKLLTDRGLPQAGNKADLIARLQENDASKKGDDEIDWDDEQPAAGKPADAPAAAAAAAPAPAAEAPAAAPAAAPVAEPAAAAAASSVEAPAAAAETTAEADITHDFDIEEELKRREARAKRFGITPGAGGADGEDDAQKLASRAARFGIDASSDLKETLLKSLDTALPDRPLKRGRGGDGARGDSKRSNSRRGGGNNRDNRDNNSKSSSNNNNRRGNGGNGPKQQPKSFLDDPAERKKAEDRAKRFGL